MLAKHGSMPFTLRAFEDEVKAKMGVVECEKHALVRPYQVNVVEYINFILDFMRYVKVPLYFFFIHLFNCLMFEKLIKAAVRTLRSSLKM